MPGAPTEVPRSECKFAYRDSIFQRQYAGSILTSVVLQLDAAESCTIVREDIAAELHALGHVGGGPAKLGLVAEAVRRIRKPKDHIAGDDNRTAGSFFKNLVTRDLRPEHVESVKAIFAERKSELLKRGHDWVRRCTPTDAADTSLIAGSLISTACDIAKDAVEFCPGRVVGRLRLGRGGPNTIVNAGEASAAEVLALARRMRVCRSGNVRSLAGCRGRVTWCDPALEAQ